MTQDDLVNIIMNIEPGNDGDTINVSQEDYDSLKKEFGQDFNAFHGPKGLIWIKIKK